METKICNYCGREKPLSYFRETDCEFLECRDCCKARKKNQRANTRKLFSDCGSLAPVDRRRELKRYAVEYLGGACAHCGLSTNQYKVYDFHHIDDSNKKYSVSQLIGRLPKWEVLQEELDKCILLCANCHRIHHANDYD